jgi:hypothetical protein
MSRKSWMSAVVAHREKSYIAASSKELAIETARN